MSEYITCSRCGIVKRGHICSKKQGRKREKDSKADRFRKTKAWTNKSIEIRQRDRYLCQCCLHNLYDTIEWLNYKTVEVHHITPINEDYNRRLDNDNLISLCSYHHKMADKGQIPREVLYDLVGKAHKE